MHFNPSRALELLRQGSSNPNAKFRDGQEEAITHLVTSTQRLLVVQKTGWGKSFVYFIATQLLRESGAGITLLISPLLALMRNQIAAAKRMGLKAVSINSENTDDWKQIEQEIISGQVDIVLISPERLANQNFINNVLSQIAGNIGLLVIDEAHCISDWGHDFRPDYRLIERIIKNLPPNLRVLATTATANQRVMDDLIAILGPNIEVSRGDLNRPSLTLQTIKLPSQIERLAWLAEQLPHLQGSGIIYTLTVRDANQVADWLKLQGFDVEAYTGESGDKRIELEDKLLNNQVKALVATTALGMGYDKPDLGFVIHYQMPNSVVAYYQQVGRAGRALSNAYGVLLSGIEDDEISEFFIDSAFPKPNEVNQILNALKQSPNGLSSNELQDNINLSQGRISKALKVLSLESPAPLVKQGTKWQLTSATLSTDFWQRVNRLTELRKNEHQQMKNYVDLPFGQHMAFLVNALDGDTQQIMPPQLPPLPTLIHPTFVQQASEFLHRSNVIIEPRKKWATGGSTQFSQKGNINPNFQAEEGRALSIWGDAGWGKLVKQGKYQDNHFADELVNACCEMIERWQPNPKPTWVTCVPSLRHPTLVPDFARRLAMKLGLPFMPIIQKIKKTEPQKMMQNSHMQAHNLDGVFQLSDNPLSEPVLLIDDMVDSRWTLTICSYLLKFNGSGAVFPLVLSQTSNQGE
ncbi:RecQ family ATP-dependent DNA helicase [Moraxella sp. ZY210820]|uniref:RecQ family ATP-dependent DNA helicase n=1 Tax=unclassified Moraxella TaxID=2685852 RepID=UPI00272F59FC|nr:RecQ family ATP-dependent DNA helicase [Moraxella sp. ZY210820]WLF83366.1 RecQ family ATP-dependent DNA helicase [Moraxella sp. ZY210820]